MDADQKAEKALGQRRQAKKRRASSEIIANERNTAFLHPLSLLSWSLERARETFTV